VTNNRTKPRKNQRPDEVNGSAGKEKQCAPAPADERTEEGLTDAQWKAVGLILAGRRDLEVAQAVNVHRVTVTRWRLYCPAFRKALAIHRANLWNSCADHLRSLLAHALRHLEAVYAHNVSSFTVSLALLKFASALPLAVPDPTDPEDTNREDEPERVPAGSENGNGATNDQPGERHVPEAQNEEPAGATEQTP
jgi:hypothetical protein